MSCYQVGVSAWGRVNHYCRPDEISASLCGVELIRNPDSITAWTLCEKCEAIAQKLRTSSEHGDESQRLNQPNPKTQNDEDSA